MAGASDKENRKSRKSITGDAATDSALWRLSLVLKEIAESTANNDVTVDDNPKPPSTRSNIRKKLKYKNRK